MRQGEIAILALILAIVSLVMVIIAQAFIFAGHRQDIENLRKGEAFLYQVNFYKAGEPEPVLEPALKNFILKGEEK